VMIGRVPVMGMGEIPA
jgi:hypothetical protein